jgi:hypothetical protein
MQPAALHHGSVIAHTFADLLSKNLWGFWSLFLRQSVRNHHRKLYKVGGGCYNKLNAVYP